MGLFVFMAYLSSSIPLDLHVLRTVQIIIKVRGKLYLGRTPNLKNYVMLFKSTDSLFFYCLFDVWAIYGDPSQEGSLGNLGQNCQLQWLP